MITIYYLSTVVIADFLLKQYQKTNWGQYLHNYANVNKSKPILNHVIRVDQYRNHVSDVILMEENNMVTLFLGVTLQLILKIIKRI